jgi:hypothetical protein
MTHPLSHPPALGRVYAPIHLPVRSWPASLVVPAITLSIAVRDVLNGSDDGTDGCATIAGTNPSTWQATG